MAKWPSMPQLVSALAFALALALGVRSARADELEGAVRKLPDTPRPPGLPSLTHADGEASIELTSGALYPRDPSIFRGHVPIHVLRIAAEQPLYRRRVFVGIANEAAYGSNATVRAPFVLVSNTEVHGRAVWATTTGLAFGAGLGVMLPTASFDRHTIAAPSLAAASVALRPWDEAFFREGSLGLRPFVDLHDVVGPFVVQLRQVLDFAIDVREGRELRLFSIASLYVGYRALRHLAVGVEAHQLYIIEANVADERRSFFAVSPSLRLIHPRVQPSIAIVKNLGAPYYPASGNLFATRLALTVLW